MDKFFDEHLSPMLQISRGCPYSCTFCHDGLAYANKTYRFSDQRVVAELEYAAARSKVPAVTLADLNWCMFPRDVTIAREMKRIQEQDAWPNRQYGDGKKPEGARYRDEQHPGRCHACRRIGPIDR